MELLPILNNLLFGSAALVGVYAIGRLFYVAGTAPTNVQQRASRAGASRGMVTYPAMALDTHDRGETEVTAAISWGSGSVTAVRTPTITSKEEPAK
jgi:hypothetical protein